MAQQAFDPATAQVPYLAGTYPSPLESRIVDALRDVYDPEIPVSVFELGLIYDLTIDSSGAVRIVMTLTTPSCPVAEQIPSWIRRALLAIDGVTAVDIELVWDPVWQPDFMSEEARLQLGWMW